MKDSEHKIIRRIVDSRIRGKIVFIAPDARMVLASIVADSTIGDSIYADVDNQSSLEISYLNDDEKREQNSFVIVHIHDCTNINNLSNELGVSLRKDLIYSRNLERSEFNLKGQNYDYFEFQKYVNDRSINIVAINVRSEHIVVSSAFNLKLIEITARSNIGIAKSSLKDIQEHTWLFFYSPPANYGDISTLMTDLGFKKKISNIPSAEQQLALKKFISSIAPRFSKMKWTSFDGDQN